MQQKKWKSSDRALRKDDADPIHHKLSPESLRGLIEEFVTRPGTDTGYTAGSLEDSVEMVMKQLRLGDVFVVYDEETETANIVPKEIVVRYHLDQT